MAPMAAAMEPVSRLAAVTPNVTRQTVHGVTMASAPIRNIRVTHVEHTANALITTVWVVSAVMVHAQADVHPVTARTPGWRAAFVEP